MSFQAKMAIAEGNLVALREAWDHMLPLLYEIDDELKNQTWDEMGGQNILEQSPQQSLKSWKQKELRQRQKKKEVLHNKLSKLMVQAQAILEGHGHNVELEIEN